MTSRKKRRRNDCAYEGLVGSSNEEESVFSDPHRVDTKTIQLCRQVEEAIAIALACSANPFLRGVYVASVEPQGGAAQLRVLVTSEGDYDYEGMHQILDRAAGYFRSEVAKAINRKRVPMLRFTVVPAKAMSDGNWEQEVGNE